MTVPPVILDVKHHGPGLAGQAERLARHCREHGWAEVAVHHRELD